MYRIFITHHEYQKLEIDTNKCMISSLVNGHNLQFHFNTYFPFYYTVISKASILTSSANGIMVWVVVKWKKKWNSAHIASKKIKTGNNERGWLKSKWVKETERRTDTYPNLRYLAIALWTYSITNRFTKWITVGWGLRSIRLEYKNITPFFFNSRKENNIRGYFHAINAFRQSLPTVVWKAKMNWIPQSS